MSGDLLAQVEADLLPPLASLGLQVIGHEESDSFGDALVVLQAGDIRVRVVRDRSQVFVDFGSAAEPGTWFDSAVVMEYLGLSENAGWHGRDAANVLAGLGSFLQSFWNELSGRFSSGAFPTTKRQLVEIREARAAKRFG